MIPYLVVFAIAAFGALRSGSTARYQPLGWTLFFPMVLFIGLRDQVGGDWFNYLRIYMRFEVLPLSEIISDLEPGYALFNWLSFQLNWGTHGANFFCALIFVAGLWRFCRAQPLPSLALTVAIPYLVIVVAMGYTRQGVAIGLGMLALLSLEQKQITRFVTYVLLAATFHKSAVVLFGLALMLNGGGWWWRIPLMTMVLAVAYQAILAESLDNYLQNYEEAGYASQGALVRVIMNVLPALIFLYWRKRMALTPSQYRIWSLLAYGALLMLPALMLASSSTAVDRVALYLIPLQLFVWARVPLVNPRQKVFWSRGVVLYSLAVLLVWLLFAANAYAWLPYRFYPFEWLFS